VTVRSPDVLARRYVAWLRRRALVVIAASVLMLVGAVYLIAFHLPLRADFSYLLPQDVPAVKDLRRLEARVKSSETVLVLVTSQSPAATATAAEELRAGLVGLQSPLIGRVAADEAETRAFLKARRHLFVPLEDLVRARDALRHRIDDAKLKANPLYIDLGDADDPETKAAAEKDKKQLEDLEAKRKDAEARLDRPTNVSPDAKVSKLEVATTFRATDAKRGEQLLDAMNTVRAKVLAVHPDVQIGFTGSVVTALAEHRAISKGILLSSLVTAALVALVLALYFRSATLLSLLVSTIGVATAVGFGAAAITVGHLNAATAFLGAIIAGNGINYGIFLIARYLEERRRHDVDEALAQAVVGTLRPTAVASLGASIAYGSLAATSFKGFADFAVIGAIGMLVCWVASYTLLPALMLRWGRNTKIYYGNPFVGSTLVRLLGFRRSTAVVLSALVLFTGASVLVARYIAADPFEYNIKNLRSEGSDAIASRNWMKVSDDNFGRGISGRTYIAADRADQVPLITEALREIDKGKPPEQQTIGTIESVQTFVPPDQEKRLAVLAEIRSMLDEALEDLPEEDRKQLAELRPPDDLAPFTANDLPAGLRDRLSEKDGRVGLLIAIRPALELDEWNGKDLIRFASAVRELHLPDGETVTTSGSSVIFADIVAAIEHDGLRVTLVALAGLILMVVLLVGRNRRAVAVMCGTIGGSLLMIAVCALVGIKVNFLDFVALPITLGLGIDYAINVAHRHESEEIPDPITTLRTSGSAVFVASLTTMIGYGSLLVSENLAIRGFGTASLIGELTTVLTALVLVPALLVVTNREAPRLPTRDAA
jgi:predicted RND superfamily exporter protein